MKQDWDKYYQRNAGREPRKLLIEAVSFCQEKESALDLGAGMLIEARYLLKNGFEKVVVIDDSVQFRSMSEKRAEKGLEMHAASFHDLRLDENKYDLISAQFSLPFYGPAGFPGFVKMIIGSLKPGGIFTGQLFGTHDAWNVSGSNLVFHTKEQVAELLSDLQILKLEEVERDSVTTKVKNKHWHVYHFIARKNKRH